MSLKQQDKLAANQVMKLLKYTLLNLICILDFISGGKPDSLTVTPSPLTLLRQ